MRAGPAVPFELPLERHLTVGERVLIGKVLDALRAVGLPHDQFVLAGRQLACLVPQKFRFAAKPGEHLTLGYAVAAFAARPAWYALCSLDDVPGLGILAAALLAFVLSDPAGLRAAGASRAESRTARRAAIRSAAVWTATNISSMDLEAGPQGPPAFAPGATIDCRFVQQPHGAGSTRKFDCVLASGREWKVRYGRDNGEVYAQVAATRLLWALGFGANRMYPVRVVCRGCPEDPFKGHAPADASKSVVFDPATIDVKADGKTIETKKDEGWSWNEVDLVDESAGGAPRAQRDALRLLAVLMQHSSSKAINQRILCLDEPACSHTLMMITDVGKTFGRANALNDDAAGAVNFKAWSRTPVWKEPAAGCVGNLGWSLTGTLHDPEIREAGRKFLADLLDQLTDVQLHDLFAVARVTQRDPSATIDDRVAAFKQKRTAIATARCAP